MTKDKYFAEQAKFTKRDLKAGSYTMSEIPEVISGIWRDDEDELRKSYGIGSLAELKQGILSRLKADKPAKKKATKKKSDKMWCPWWCK